ncbi:hypothetical protein LP415_10395 [Polaromonas sp. P1(28)-8]|nr:hypothetical protein LP415_10395 [Polaromonas sp. P1(28)-8]
MNQIFQTLVLAAAFVFPALAISGPMTIKLYPPDPESRVIGEQWAIYLDGEIDKNAPARLAAALAQNSISGGYVLINSPGGNLFAGMELGKIIRNRGLSTFVAKEGSKKFDAQPGGCYSACVLAYAGGYYRHSKAGSQIGVHRFSTTTPSSTDLDAAQITSAVVINYLAEMGVDVALFDRMVRAGKDEILVLRLDDLKMLRVINDGILPAIWTIEATDKGMYLKGVQVTWRGEGKSIFFCDKGHVMFGPLYEAGANAEMIVKSAIKHSIRIDDDFIPLGTPVDFSVQKHYVAGLFSLDVATTKRLTTASSVGYAAHPSNPALFYGFTVEMTSAREKISSFLTNCLNGR